MNILNQLICFFILTVTICSSCSRDEITPDLEGDIIGYAFCGDEYGEELDDFSGIRVYTEPNRKYSAITDKKGRFVLKNVVNGTYNLSYEKDDFGTMKLFGIKHLGGYPTLLGYYNHVIIYKKITTHITAIQYHNDSIAADLSLSGAYRPWIIFIRLFFSTSENFDIETAEAAKSVQILDRGTYYETYYGYISEGLPFIPGQKLYCKAALYTDSRYSSETSMNVACQYYNYEIKTIVFPNLSNETYEFSFTMP